MSTPSIRGFQLDGSAIGNAANSVNLYRGDVNLPLKLIDLKGPHGLDLSLAAYYSSNVDQSWDTWNRDAPTGILGLGWMLPFSFIGFSGGGTASFLEGSFTLHISGSSHPLVLLSYTGSAADNDEALTFADPANPLWTFAYTPATESWQVQRDDGISMVFGDSASGRATLQWGVRWGNWAGNSSSSGGNPERYALAWNLSTMSNPWGQAISYRYLDDTQPLTSSLSYSRASYLGGIVDGYGRTVVFHYADKNPLEYQAPHTVDGAPPDAGYQDRYQTRYLSQVDVYSPGGDSVANLYYSLIPGYELKDPEQNTLTATCKRYLVSLAQQRTGIELLPAMRFAYQLDTSQPGPGRLQTVSYPSGGTVDWTYAELELADGSENDNIFNLSYTAKRPSDSQFDDATPRLWFGANYVIVGWYAGDSLALRVYSYGGRWSEPFCCALDGVNPQVPASTADSDADKLQQIRICLGVDFFALHYHNQGNSSDDLRIFQKAIDQFGLWTVSKYDCELDSSSIIPQETSLVCGNDFAALHVGGSSQLFRFRYSPVSRGWSQDDPVSYNSSASHIALIAQHNTLAACFFSGSGPVHGETVIYWLDGSYCWQHDDQFDSTDSFDWDSSYVDSYWVGGPGFVVGTCIDDGDAHLQIIHWQRNFAGFSLRSETIDNGSQSTVAGGNALFNAGTLYRYNGDSWIKTTLGWQPDDLLAASDDTVLRVRRNGSNYNENELCSFDAQSNSWSISGFQNNAGLQSYAYPAGPQFSGDFLTVSNQVFYRGTDVTGANAWQLVTDNTPLVHCYGSTVSNLSPGFIVWQNQDNRQNPDPSSLESYAALPKNGDLLSVSAPYSGQKVQSIDGSTLLSGANAFASYDADISDFSDVSEFTLRRVLNYKLSDPTATAVVSLTIDTAQQQLSTRYDYDASTALFDDSGTVVQFPSVTATRLSAIDGSDLGSTAYQYFNGQAPDNAIDGSGENCLVGCGDSDDLCAHYSLANGYLHTVTDCDSDGVEVARMVNSWLPLTFDSTFTTLQQRSTLRSAGVTHQFPNLAITNLDGSANPGDSATLSRTQSFQYDPATGRILSNTLSQYNSRGEQETRTVSYDFAWSEYHGMKSARRLKELCKTRFSTTIGGTTLVQAFVQTFSDSWPDAAAVWDQQQAWSWLGSDSGNTDASFDFGSSGHSGWQQQTGIEQRNPKGFTSLSRDALDTPTLTLFDRGGLWPLAKLVNADNGLFCGFESYEDLSDWSLSGGAAVVAGDAHSGRQCAHLPAGGGLENTALSIAAGQWVFSCRVRSSATSDATWILTTAADSSQLRVPCSDDWQYLFHYLDVSQDDSAVSLALSNSSGTLLVDEVRLTPLLCPFSARVYNSDTWYPLAQLGANGETVRTFYDDRLRVIASAGPDDNVQGIQSLYYSDAGLTMFSASPPNPNSRLTIKAADGGPWDDFRDGVDWSSRWTGSSSAWSVADQSLTHQRDGCDTVTLNGSDNYANYAVQVRVSAASAPAGDLGIQVGSELTVQWQAASGQWQLRVGGELVDSADGEAGTLMHWLLIAGESGVQFLLDDQLLLSYANGSQLGGRLGLFATDSGVGFGQVLVALSPLVHINYLDGTHQAVQSQQLADNQLVVRQTLRDPLGRTTIHTKAAIYDATMPCYQAGFVSGFDHDSGLMTGFINDYYQGQDGRSDDGGYPYQRHTIENSTLARPQQQGKPGAAHAIGAAGGHITRFEYGVNGTSVLFDGGAEQQYKLGLTIDPEGNTVASLTDLLGNVVGNVRGGAGLPPGSLISACLRDEQDNPATIQSPNWFQPPSGSPADWTTDAGFDYHNRPLNRDDSNEGKSASLRDSQGRLRFRLIADGLADDNSNPCHAQTGTPVSILYSKYDPLGRITEQGRYCVAAWSDVATHVDDQDWPTDAADWRFRHSYDGDDSQPCCIGRATDMQTNNPGGIVTESFAYDIRGRVVSYTLDDAALGTEGSPQTSTFAFDCIGRPTRIDYPALGSLPALSVVYGYDARGLAATIGTSDEADHFAKYSHNAAGQVESLSLANTSSQPITRSYAYAPAGWPISITDSGNGGTISREQLYYDESNADGSNTPRYDGLLSALRYQRGCDGADHQWSYGYDHNARLLTATLAAGDARGYRYDGNGNPTSITIGGNSTSLSYDGCDRLQSAADNAFGYAASGEVTSSGNLTLGYDFNTRLTTAITDTTSGDSISLRYGSGAQRLYKQVDGGSGQPLSWRRYVTGPRQQPLQEQRWDANSGSTRELRYLHGVHGILALQSDGEDYFLLHDHQRSPRILLADAAADPVAVLDYLPFGGAQNSAGSNPDLLIYRYSGQEWDSETGLYNFRHRLYDPAILRFYAPDPKHQYFSPYLYVGDHPLLLTDPSGEFGIGNITGIIESTDQILAGALLVGVGAAVGSQVVMGAGGALIGGGAMTMDYSIRAKHFSEGEFLQVDAAATIATAEFEAGVLLSSESGGLGLAIGSGALTGAGGAGYADVFKQVNSNPDAKFDWGEWGIAEGTGAITGAVAGGVGYGIGSALGVMGSDAAEAGGDEVAGEMPGRKFAMDETEEQDSSFDYKHYAGRIVAKTTGRFAGGMAGESFNYGMTAWYNGTRVKPGQWVLDSLVVGGEQAATQFATGLVSEAYTPETDTGKAAFAVAKRAVRIGIGQAWSALVKLP